MARKTTERQREVNRLWNEHRLVATDAKNVATVRVGGRVVEDLRRESLAQEARELLDAWRRAVDALSPEELEGALYDENCEDREGVYYGNKP